MLEKLPDELIYMIFDIIIEPYNNFYYILKESFIDYNNIIVNIGKHKMICYLCLQLYNKIVFIKNGCYCGKNHKPICRKHIYNCISCQKNIDIHNYSIMTKKCLRCYTKIKPLIIN